MKKKNAIILGTVCFIAIILLIGFSGYKIYSKIKSYDNSIYPGVRVDEQDLSGKTKMEAKKVLEDKYENSLQNKKINIKSENKNYSITYAQIGAKYDINKAVNEAYNYGKDESLFNKYNMIKNPTGRVIKLSFTYDSNSKAIDDLIKNIQNSVNKEPKNARIYRNGTGFSIIPDQDGYGINQKELKSGILSSINDVVGQDSNVEAKIETVKAKITKEKLESINTLISTYSTSYGSISSAERVNNIQLATRTISGTVIMPGDTFSFNGILGKRTAEKGYEAAPVDIGKTTGMGLGGGICQVSSTLYNAALLGGIKPTVRIHHTIPSVYVPLGHDATVDYDGKLDYQFKNTFNYPIYIEGISSSGTETFNIYSNESLKSKTYKVVDQPYNSGKSVKIYLQTYQNGNMIANDLISNDSY